MATSNSIPAGKVTMGQLDSARAATGQTNTMPKTVPTGLVAGAATRASKRRANPALGILPPNARGMPARTPGIQQPAMPLPSTDTRATMGMQQGQGLPMVPGRTMPASSMAPQRMQATPGMGVQQPPAPAIPLPAQATANMPMSPQSMPVAPGQPAPMVQRPQTLGEMDAARAQSMGLVRNVR